MLILSPFPVKLPQLLRQSCAVGGVRRLLGVAGPWGSMVRARAASALVLLVVAGALAGCAQRADTGEVRLGFFPNLTHAAALVGIHDGLFAQRLGAANVTFVEFNAGPSAMEAMFAGQLDATYVGPGPAISAYVQSHGEALRVVAGATAGGASLMVRPAANIHGAADFAGKRVASPQIGNTQDLALRHWLQQQGLRTTEQGGSVQLSALPNADILTLFLKGQLDAAWVPEPWATRLAREAGAQTFLDERSLWPGGQFETTHLVVTTALLRGHPDRVRALLEAHLDATLRVQQQPAQALASVQAELANRTKPLPQAEASEALAHMNASWDPEAASVRTYAQWSSDLGFIKGSADVDGLWDLSLLNQALAARGLPEVRA
jgi:NitT/TauT family transport system substrate-binding protein